LGELVLIEGLGLPREWVEALRKAGLWLAFDLALASPSFVANALSISLSEAERLVEEAARRAGVERRRAEGLEGGVDRVTTCSRSLDALLGGGVEAGWVTEFYGAYASGKTKLCHQLCVNAQLPASREGLGARAAYIDVDGSFRPERAKEMAEALGLDPVEALRKILVFKPRRVEEQMAAVEELSRVARKVRLVAVDTVVGLFRAEYGEDVMARQWRLILHMEQLHSLAELGVAVVLANQVVAGPRGEELPAGGVALDAGLTKVRVAKAEGRWRARLEASPNQPEGEAFFKVVKEGVRDP